MTGRRNADVSDIALHATATQVLPRNHLTPSDQRFRLHRYLAVVDRFATRAIRHEYVASTERNRLESVRYNCDSGKAVGSANTDGAVDQNGHAGAGPMSVERDSRIEGFIRS